MKKKMRKEKPFEIFTTFIGKVYKEWAYLIFLSFPKKYDKIDIKNITPVIIPVYLGHFLVVWGTSSYLFLSVVPTWDTSFPPGTPPSYLGHLLPP